jgi:hypothetical protein
LSIGNNDLASFAVAAGLLLLGVWPVLLLTVLGMAAVAGVGQPKTTMRARTAARIARSPVPLMRGARWRKAIE